MSVALRRSSRSVKRIRYSEDLFPVYPEAKPSNEFEALIARLNQQAFTADIFSKIDDIIVYALFGTKRKHRSNYAWTPELSLQSSLSWVTREEGILIRQLYGDPTPSDMSDRCRHADDTAKILSEKLPQYFNQDTSKVTKHLLLRYGLIYSSESSIRIEKVSFDKETLSGGLKAKHEIPAGVPILVTCTSMSSDLMSNEAKGISIIHSHCGQKGPLGSRLMLGPLRFVNHDCRPNCQLRPIKNSHAIVLYTLQDISEGELITVKYTLDTSYFPHGCRCASCHPEHPPTLRRRPAPTSSEVQEGKIKAQDKAEGRPRKKTRRGGVRQRQKRDRQLEALKEECLGRHPC